MTRDDLQYCPRCGKVGLPVTRRKGSFATEIALWILVGGIVMWFVSLLFVAPPLVYSIWRANSRTEVCPSCGTPNMIPANSPHARHGGR